MYNLYTLDGKFIENSKNIPDNFTGAVEYPQNYKLWYLNGKYHKDNGPAVEYFKGPKWYFLHGKEVTKEQHEHNKLLLNLKRLKGI